MKENKAKALLKKATETLAKLRQQTAATFKKIKGLKKATKQSKKQKSTHSRFDLLLKKIKKIQIFPSNTKNTAFASKAKASFDKILHLKVEKLPEISALLDATRVLRFPLYFLFGLLAADLLMKAGSSFLIESPEKKKTVTQPQAANKSFMRSKGSYDDIISKNIFCPGCPVPDMKTIAINRPKDCNKAKPLRSGANLVGTIVLSNANYSVATIIDGGTTFALKRGEEFKTYGSVFEIRRTRVCFENPEGLLYYLQLPDVEEVIPQQVAQNTNTSNRKEVARGIVQTGEHDLEIDKNFIVEQLNNPNILYEAYATEYRVDGEVKGFRIHSINPGSSIEKLGFLPGDIIQEVDGRPMDSVARAQELYNTAATTTDMTIKIIRDGNTIEKTFTVK